jgi:hypothetical protein
MALSVAEAVNQSEMGVGLGAKGANVPADKAAGSEIADERTSPPAGSDALTAAKHQRE